MVASPTDITLISRLIDGADKAAAAGQQREALRLLGEAQAAAPGHPRVLSALGLYSLKAGDLPAGRRYLNDAVAADPQSAPIWFHLALICRAQGDAASEMVALDRALALDPRFYLALLQKATLLERQGKPRQAAQFFIYFLHWVPPSAQQPPELKQAVQYAQKAVDADKAALGAFIRERLESIPAAHGEPQDRFEHCLDVLLGRRRVYTPKPTFMHFPRLPALEFYDRKNFPWLDAFEAATDAIRGELLQVVSKDLSEGDIVPYVAYPDGVPLEQWRDLNRSLQWGAYYLMKDGVRIPGHLARCPTTAALLAAAPLADVPGHAPTAFFSLLKPRTRIPPHTGVTNTRLVVHVPLIVPPGCGFRVGSETREWQPGHAWVFDDTIEHEAWNDSDEPRAILIVDVWNPYLTAAERALVSAATAAVADFKRE
jgi:aspartyl/asparaginyl beta-hydroxylase (cupin superfamily)/Tfp pilus assembly protein PilF